MEVPLLDLKAQYQSIKPEIDQTVAEVLSSQHFIMGPVVKQFEQQIAEYCKADFAFGCASGSDALLLALMAADITPGDYVITTPFTFFATAGAINRLGAIPVFLDIDAESFNIDVAQVRAFLEGEHPLRKKWNIASDKIKAIIPVHLYGQMARMDDIMELAKTHNLVVVEDAAQSIGAEYRGVKAGNFGDFGCFSFFPSKNLGAYGDGGLITAKDPEIAAKVDILRLHGAKPKYHHKLVGINSRLDTLQAAILSIKLKYLDQWSEQRRKIAQTYNQLFHEAGIVGSLEADGCSFDPNKIIIPTEREGHPDQQGRHIYHQYTIRTQKREQLTQALTKAGIGHAIYYPIPLHIQECFAHLGYEPEDCPQAMHASRQVLSLPIYPELTLEQVEYVVANIQHAIDTV